MVKIYNPQGVLMTPEMLAGWANRVHREVGKAKGSPFTPDMFCCDGPDNTNYRLGGDMCNCGYDEETVGHPTLGEFDLEPIESEDVQEGMKAYMICRCCGCVSHL